MNNWILTKLLAYLTAKEGFTISEEPEDVINGKKATIQDVFGYRYEVQVKVLGRIQNDNDDETSFDGLGIKIASLTNRLEIKKAGK